MNKTLFLLMIALLRVEDCSAKTDEMDVMRNLENNPGLPLTGNQVKDDQFRRQLAEAVKRAENGNPMPPFLAKKFDDLSYHLGLDHPELLDSAMGLAASGRRMANNLQSQDTLITPDNIKSMPLGAMVWTGQSTFARRSIFDPGILNGLSLIPNLQGKTEHGQTSKVSSRTDKDGTSSKFTENFGASVRYVGFGSSLGYKHDEAQDKTSMEGGASATVYTYATNTVRVEAEQGEEYMELRGALRGKPFDKSALNKYLEITTVPVTTADNSKESSYTRVRVIKSFDGGVTDAPFDWSANAHIQALMLFEITFGDLKLQYERFQGNEEVQQRTLVDMMNLRNAINTTIKNFQVKWGDSFVTEVSGYSEVQGKGVLNQKSGTGNFERNNSGTLTAGYSSFIGGGELSNSIGHWLKEANAYGASEIITTVSEKPNNGTNLSAYETSLNTWLNNAIKDTGASAQLPPVAITPSMPTIPQVRPATDDPFSPPKEMKEFKAWKEAVQEIGEGQGYKLPDWLKKKNQEGGKPNPEDAAKARENVAKEMVGDDVNRRGGDPIRTQDVPDFSKSLISLFHEDNSGSISTSAIARVSSARRGRLLGESLHKKIQSELKALKVYGRKESIKRHRAITKKWAASAGSTRLNGTVTSDPSEIILDKMLVSNFKVLPYTAVLGALRPNLELPAPLNVSVDGFVNASVLLATLNRYYTLDTYLNFISSIPESGLKGTSIPSDLHRYVGHLENTITALVQTSMSSGNDVSDAVLMATLNKELVGLSSDGQTRTIEKTQLYKELGNDDEAYNYVYQLAENPANYRVIGKAPGGYLPLSLGPSRDGQGTLCLPKLAQVKQLVSYKSDDGYQPTYVHASECKEITANTDIPRLMAGHPQSPMFPLFVFASGNYDPILNFVQFVGGTRLIIGRDVTMAPMVDDLTKIPENPLTEVSDEKKLSLGYKPNMTGDPTRLQRLLKTPYGDFNDDRSREGVYLNAFLPSDITWNYSPWFRNNDSGSIKGFYKNEVLTVKIGDYNTFMKNVIGPPQSAFLGRGDACSKNSYCLVTTNHLMAPYSFKIDPSAPDGSLGSVSKYSYLIGPVGSVGSDGDYALGKLESYKVPNALGTTRTGGLMLLYPVTTEMLNKLGNGVFAYSSGSKPKDIYNMDDDGKSPFDKGFSESLLK